MLGLTIPTVLTCFGATFLAIISIVAAVLTSVKYPSSNKIEISSPVF